MKFSGIVVSTVADLLGLLLESFEHLSIFTQFFFRRPSKAIFIKLGGRENLMLVKKFMPKRIVWNLKLMLLL